jgi:hypothetical protein
MKKRMLNLWASLALLLLMGQVAFAQVQFRVDLALQIGAAQDTLTVGISGDGPGGTINDNTYNLDPVGATFGELGLYGESAAPPGDPDGNRVRWIDIPGRTTLGQGLFRYDFRGFTSPSQVDTFAARIDGLRVETSGVTISWPNNLSSFGTSWILYSRSGAVLTQVANMLTSTSYTFAPAAPVQFVVIKVGAGAPSPGPTFALNTTSLNFGNVPVGGSATLPVQVSNTGTTNPLSITGIASIPNYSIVPNPPGAFPISVGPGASRTFDVIFSPTAPGVAAGNIVFTHNAPGSPSNLAVTGTGQSQGGTLQFAGPTRTRFDNTNDYRDSLQLAGYVGNPLKALQLHVVTNGLLIVRSVERGSDIPSPGFSFSSVIARGPVNADGSTNDTIKVVIFGNGSSALPPGTYNSLVRFSYDVVNISDPVQTTTISLQGVLGSDAQGGNAGVTAGPNQNVTVNNKTVRGDINNDDHVDIIDLLMIVDHILNRITLTGDQLTRADVAPWLTPDGVVNVQDLAQLQDIILTGQYPDGTPLGRPLAPPIAGNGTDGPAKLNPGVDAKLTFHVTENGIAVRLETAVAVKGMQVEFGGISAIPANLAVTTILGEGFQRLVNSTLRVLMYNQSSEVLAPGEYIVAHLPFTITDPSVVTLENLVLAGEGNTALENVETEFSYADAPELPTEFQLSQNFPNPFNPTTDIRFSVPQTSDVRISIYNMLGQEVRTLVSGVIERGTAVVRWDGKDNNGVNLSSGTYLYRMTAGSFVQSYKMVLLK